ncbi:hypothetical protein TNCV_2630231 [Trichonephila clavipes]|uniref:Uncharacterized protein n=1 Tax=Trichonephila clavipes TaxID=2585209 RepID=A0A8X6SBY7_TRICX|nr:hypothetical protein TNCV_2630231 [Trichonephila clavipes]
MALSGSLPQINLDVLGPVATYRASTQQVRGSKLRLGKVDSAFHSFSRSINEFQACLVAKTHGVSLQTDHLIGTSALIPQHHGHVYWDGHSRPWPS